jgi:hypothetical protein
MPPRRRDQGVRIRADQIPNVRRTLPVLQAAPRPAATEFVRDTVQRLVPHVEHRELTNGAIASYDGDRLVSYTDPNTGEATIVPLIDGLQGERSLRTAARAGMRELLDQQSHLFTDGVSRVVASAPIQLMASNRTRRGTQTTPRAMLSTVTLRRRIGRVPVFGPGSKASAAFSSTGLEALNHSWNAAVATGERISAHPNRAIVDRIVEHLGDLPETRSVDLHDVQLAYYDDGHGTVQPVYRYRVVLPVPKGARTAPGMLVGYLPIGDHVGDLPPLVPTPKVLPKDALKRIRLPRPYTGTTVGRYVVRQDNAGWVASANAFWTALTLGAALLPGGPTFQDRQYYWAEPRLFLNEKDSFVNSVNFAQTEVHGNWNLFTTLKNNADYVQLRDIPDTGYGGNHAGSLAYWLLHSCEVIPTATDENTSFDAWWDIFNGLHAAIGYRTEMWINDEVTSKFGLLVGLGAAVVSSWLSTVINDNDYQDGDTYYDGNRNITEPMGRPSAIAVTGHGDDTAMMINPLPKPSSLTQWWYDN